MIVRRGYAYRLWCEFVQGSRAFTNVSTTLSPLIGHTGYETLD